jgi:hypothetical protein
MGSPAIGSLLCDGIFRVAGSFDRPPDHQLTVLEPGASDWLRRLARVYRKLRTESIIELRPVVMNGVTIADMATISQIMAERLVPHHGPSNFNVVRSDFAEVVLGLIGETHHDSRYGYRGARDRELIKLPGRGADALGVEGDFLTGGVQGRSPRVVIGEAKTSSAKSVPAVVDRKDDSLRNQHQKHISDLTELEAKLLHSSTFARDPAVCNDLMVAALSYREGQGLPIICSSVLIRPGDRVVLPADLGSFYTHHASLLPATIRFYVLVVPDSVTATVATFGDLARQDDAPESAEEAP